jgi:hypothetical protein
MFLLALGGTLSAQDAVHTSTVTLSAGGQVYSYDHFDERGGPAFDGRYEYRLWKYFALEAGVDTLLPESHTALLVSLISNGVILTSLGSNCGNCVIVPIAERTQVRLLPFGAKGILPIVSGRVELFAGIGGAYAWHSDYGQTGDGMLAQANLGGRFALDQKRHFWLGTSLRGYSTGYSNYGSNRQTWVSWTADFALRFGH